MVHPIVKKLGYDSYFQMLKSFAVDAIIIYLLFFFGEKISDMDLYCSVGEAFAENETDSFVNVTLEVPGSDMLHDVNISPVS